jgi:hypothetical protein
MSRCSSLVVGCGAGSHMHWADFTNRRLQLLLQTAAWSATVWLGMEE